LTGKVASKVTDMELGLVDAQDILGYRDSSRSPLELSRQVRDEKGKVLELEIPKPERQRQDRSR